MDLNLFLCGAVPEPYRFGPLNDTTANWPLTIAARETCGFMLVAKPTWYF
jgi:hypothetical protein